jgi:hypothetical protein
MMAFAGLVHAKGVASRGPSAAAAATAFVAAPRSLQGLDRGLLVDAQYDRVVRRVEVEPEDVVDLGREVRVAADFVGRRCIRSDGVRHSASRVDNLPMTHSLSGLLLLRVS